MKTISILITDIEEDPPWVCAVCGKPAVALLNGKATCADDLDRVMAEAFAPLYQLIGRITWENRPHNWRDEEAGRD